MEVEMYDLIIIGGGPAGLTSAIYAIRKRLNFLLLTKDLGGKTNFHLALPWIQDYQVIRGLELVNKFRSELEYLDFARHMEPVEKVKKSADAFEVITKGGAQLDARAIIIATGARQVRMDVPGEKEFTMKGLCYSALSYAPLCIDKETIVIGDGELAIRSAAELSTVSSIVHLICKETKILSTPLGMKLQQATNVVIHKGSTVLEVKGDQFARSLVIKNPDGKVAEITADAIFVEQALTPMSDMVKDLVTLDSSGRIIVDGGNRTNMPGIFAAGDVTNLFAEQVLIAIGEGAKAALSAYEYLLPTLELSLKVAG
jgi:alkyl hydroperoxide reductase subunit F